MSNNPLRQYFRQPAIYLRLPSGGQYYPPGTIEMPANGELPVLPMTAIDEITYRTPDALYNGQATVDVIQSCLPNIKNAWALPSMDVDAVLVAIRIASYGHEMDFQAQCPKCQSENPHSLDLRSVLDRIKPADYNKTVDAGDMQIFFKPITYKDMNDNNAAQLENQKIMQMLPDAEVADADKVLALNEALKRITKMSVHALTQSIAAIKTPTAMVTESQFVEEFLQNCEKQLFDRIRDHVIATKSAGEIQPLQIVCPDCKHTFEQPLTLDMASFFAYAS